MQLVFWGRSRAISTTLLPPRGAVLSDAGCAPRLFPAESCRYEFSNSTACPSDGQAPASGSPFLLLKLTFAVTRSVLVFSACSPAARDLQLMP